MKSRGIAAGASVIALVLSGGAQAAAAGLSDLGPGVSTETSAGVQANAQLGGVRTKAGLDTSHWADTGHGKIHQGGDARGAVEVKSHAHGVPSVSGRQSVRVRASGHLSPNIGGAKVTPRLRVRGDTRLGTGSAQVKASARLSAIGEARGPKGTRVKAKAGGRFSVALHAKKMAGPGGQRLAKQAKHGHFLALRGIGREVGNPLQLQLAGLLLALAAGICMGVGRLARRRLS